MQKRLVKKILIWAATISIVIVVVAYLVMDYKIDKMLHMVAGGEQANTHQKLTVDNNAQ